MGALRQFIETVENRFFVPLRADALPLRWLASDWRSRKVHGSPPPSIWGRLANGLAHSLCMDFLESSVNTNASAGEIHSLKARR